MAAGAWRKTNRLGPERMTMIKNILGRIYLVYLLIVFMITMLIVFVPIWIISMLPEPKRARALHSVFKVWMGAFMPLIFCPVSRKGKEKFKKGQQYVVVINHNSFMDIPVSSPWIPGPNKTLAKIEISKVPIFGIIYKCGSILVDRKSESSRKESFTQMRQTLSMGIHLCLYPEGTRNKSTEAMQPFFDGAFVTAIRSQAPIMPGVIFNTGKILPHDKKLFAWPMPVRFHFLDPIPTAGLSMKDLPELKNKVHKVMSEYYIANQNNKKA
ncbi:MAG: 1-acyl-sn-glycerol-3-phosphate acyltransferase [Flavipsychrobacter sp.]|nr:1-acyl-sn-glycerol-3-phosphate acyltransferase [Flavipsychrobacter sp.]